MSLLQCPFGKLALGNVLGEDHNSGYITHRITPRSYFPTEPLNGAVHPLEPVGIGTHNLPREPTAMDFFPALGNFREDFVVRNSAQVTIPQVVVA